MSNKFIIKSRHGTIYYFRRRVPKSAQKMVGKQVLVQSLGTSDRRLAIIRGRSLATQTDSIFKQISMATKSNKRDGSSTEFIMKIDFNEFGKLSSVYVDAEPSEMEAVNSAIKTVLEKEKQSDDTLHTSQQKKAFSGAIAEYFAKSQIKAQTKATYKSKLDHAEKFFNETRDVLTIDQADFVAYCDHVLATVTNLTSQGHYMTTVATFLNWFRVRNANLPPLTTKTLIPKRNSPESEDRDAFTIEQIGFVFENAKQYKSKNPYKFWVSIAPLFLGCRIEELCQVNLKSDLRYDEEADIWYLEFDGRPDQDGVTRKSMKKVSSWRHAPIHPALIKHGFIDFLKKQLQAGFQRPFQKEWKPREVESEFGQIVKWSHYISRWGGRELDAIAKNQHFDATSLAYFHSMRHTFKQILGDAGVSSEISEALSGRRYAGADAERYDKLKLNHRRLYSDGIEHGLESLSKLFEKIMAS